MKIETRGNVFALMGHSQGSTCGDFILERDVTLPFGLATHICLEPFEHAGEHRCECGVHWPR